MPQSLWQAVGVKESYKYLKKNLRGLKSCEQYVKEMRERKNIVNWLIFLQDFYQR